MKTYYKATFSDGTVVKRQSHSRKYTHAWIVRRATRRENVELYGPSYDISGFCHSNALAQDSINRYGGGEGVIFREVAPVVEVTRKEHRS